MKAALAKVVIGDPILQVLFYFLLADLKGRDIKAVANRHDSTTWFLVLTRFFEVSGRELMLQTSPALEWVRIIARLLVAVNAIPLLRLSKPMETPKCEKEQNRQTTSEV